MAYLETDRGWGRIYDPETDQDVVIGDEIDTDVALRIADRYGPVTAILESDDEQPQPENPTCVGNDGECSRSVDEPGATCWQH